MSNVDQLIKEGGRLIAEQQRAEQEDDYEGLVLDKTTDALPIDLRNLPDDGGLDPLFDALNTKHRATQRALSEIETQLENLKNSEPSRIPSREFFWRVFPFTQWHVDWWHSSLHKMTARSENDDGIDPYAAANSLIDAAYSRFYDLALPKGGETWIVESLAYLEKAHRPSYEPDTNMGVETLDYAYFAAAYAFALRDLEGSLSEQSIKALEEIFQAHFRVYLYLGAKPILDNPEQKKARSVVSHLGMYKQAYIDHDEIIVSILDRPEFESLKTQYENWPSLSEEALMDTVGPYLSKIEDAYSFATLQAMAGLHLFRFKARGPDRPGALRIYAHTLACFEATLREPDSYGADAFRKRDWQKAYVHKLMDEWDRYGGPLHKEAMEVFNNLKESSEGAVLWSEVSKHVETIIKVMESSDDVNPDAAHSPYWMEAQGWLRGSKLEPGELRDELRREEDEKAEQRLRKYFFDNAQWGALPERARSSLVEADRVWYSHRLGNPGAVLGHIQKAVEEVLFDLFKTKRLNDFVRSLESGNMDEDLNTTYTEEERGFIKTRPPRARKRTERYAKRGRTRDRAAV